MFYARDEREGKKAIKLITSKTSENTNNFYTPRPQMGYIGCSSSLLFLLDVLIPISLFSLSSTSERERNYIDYRQIKFFFKVGWIFQRLWCKRRKIFHRRFLRCFVLWTRGNSFLSPSIPLKIKFPNINKSLGWRVEIIFWLNFAGKTWIAKITVQHHLQLRSRRYSTVGNFS